jgi:uncharacterized protein (DUF1800 family)
MSPRIARLRRIGLLTAIGLIGAGVWQRNLVTASAETFANDDQTILHVLNRIAFGPRPGDLEAIRAMGLQRYIDNQLHPERIADSEMSARLGGLTSVHMSSREIADNYEIPQLEARRNKKAEAAGNGQDQPMAPDPVQQKANSVIVELSEQKILRAVYSDRQLQEVLTDFWFNHFNVDARKGPDRFMLTEYEREVIRPHVLGKFRDLLEADTKSPAMLFYLDNWMSADPNGPHADPRVAARPRIVRGPFGGPMLIPGQPRPQAPANGKNAPKGLNENYGRELMELHTLGVDGGYTQKDVTEVARCFTGWTIQNPRQGGDFKFEPRIHDPGEKVVLGHIVKPNGGESDGEQVLDILANHPSTARFIATKLVRRFVSDTPPPALVDRVAARFRQTNGDLREVMRTILTSSEFSSPEAYRAKVKTPFEFLVSALRATGVDVQNAVPLVRTMQQLGMPLYMCQPPTGYKDTAEAWVNTGAIVNRMNFALTLASDRLPGTSLDSGILGSGALGSVDPQLARAKVVEMLLGNNASETTLDTIAKATSVPQMAALTLGAPEFQRR